MAYVEMTLEELMVEVVSLAWSLGYYEDDDDYSVDHLETYDDWFEEYCELVAVEQDRKDGIE